MAKKIFVVDDSKIALEIVRETLGREGYEVFEAADGVVAHRQLKSQDVDLLITDLNMPNMNGIDLAKTVRRMPEKKFLPILIMTTNKDERDVRLAEPLSIAAWLDKATEMTRLPKMVGLLIGA